VDAALKASDAMAAQAAMKMFQGSCGGCHKQYRAGDGKDTPYSFRPDF
jgi:cytochrome c556